jgi:hypothetical protein
MVLRLGHIGQKIRNTSRVLKPGEGEKGDDQLDRSCTSKKRRSITQGQRGEEYPTYSKTKES